MTSSNSRVVLSDIYKTQGLATREAATAIADRVRQLDESEVEIDFSGTNYASIAFLDQLQHDLRTTGKSIRYVNVSDFIQQLIDVIERRRVAG
jgi:hypothetical protein